MDLNHPITSPNHINQRLVSDSVLQELMQQVVERGVFFRFQAGGNSMFPFIRDGDVLLVSPFQENTVHLGDILAFRNNMGKLLVHRVIRKSGPAFLMLGDNCSGQPDGWILKNDVFGIITRIERGGKSVRLGLGVEKAAVAWLSRLNILVYFVRVISRLRHRMSSAIFPHSATGQPSGGLDNVAGESSNRHN